MEQKKGILKGKNEERKKRRDKEAINKDGEQNRQNEREDGMKRLKTDEHKEGKKRANEQEIQIEKDEERAELKVLREIH